VGAVDQPGFDEFFQAHYQDVVRALSVALGSREQAEDAAQEGFARCLNRWGSVSVMERPAAWVYVVALRAQRRRLGRERPPGRGATGGEPDESMANSLADTVASRDWAEGVLRRLPQRQRTALVLRYLVDLPLADVAAAMGCSLGTVKATIHQALVRLRVQQEVDVNAG
jgi:RNA polymerase sigma-70 factor (ECF subfamily)